MNPSFPYRLVPVTIVLISLLGIAFMGGCGGNSESESDPTAWIEERIPTAEKKPDFVTEMARDFFRNWLTDHGETAIVSDELGIGIEGNATRLVAFHYGTDRVDTGCTVETEFRITLPDGREIVEFLAGTGDTEEAAVNMTFLNFTLSTFHVVYSCFMNTDDPHMTHERITADGNEWIMTTGGMFAIGGDEPLDFSDVSKAFQNELPKLTLSNDVHWLKVVYARGKSEVVSAAVTLDNKDQDWLTSRLDTLPWPPTESFYLAKEFIVLRPGSTAAEDDSSDE